MKSPSLKRLKSDHHRLSPLILFPFSFFLFTTAPLFLAPHSLLPVSAQTANARKAEADRLEQQGDNLSQTRQYQVAIQSYERALAIFRAIQDRRKESYVLSKLGFTYSYLSQYGKAIEFYQQALTIDRQLGNRSNQALMLGSLGSAYTSLSQPGIAIEYHQHALRIQRRLGNRLAQAVELSSLGLAYNVLSQPGRAIEYYEQALAIDRQLGNRDREALMLGSLGAAYGSFSQYDRAIKYYQQALAVYRQIGDGDRKSKALVLSGLGFAYASLSQPNEAIAYHQQALALYRQIGDRNGEALERGGLGSAYRSLSQYGKAIESYQQALALYRQTGNRNGEAVALNALGEVYTNLSQHDRAIEFLQQALSISRQIGDFKSEADILGSFGNVYSSLSYGMASPYSIKAIEFYQRALPLFQRIGSPSGEAATLGNLGKVYRSLARFDEAIKSYEQALRIFRQIGDRNSEAIALDNLGSAYYYLGQYRQALDYRQQALPIYRQVGDRAGEGITLNNLGLTLLKTGNVKAAESHLFAAIAVLESLRPGLTDESKVSLFEGQVRTYRTLQQVLIAQNKFLPALEIAERGRAKAFVELLAQRLSSSSVSADSSFILSQDQIREIARTQNATLVQYSIIYDDFRIEGKVEPHEAALYIWVVQPTGEITFREVDLKPLWQQHNAWLPDVVIGNQEFMAVRSRSIDATKSQPNLPTLHQLLIDPIADLLPKDPNAHVIFIPQGALFQVPFPALQDANGTYLIQKHTILTAPSIQVLALTHQQRQKLAAQPQGNALVLGNPTMPSVSSALGTLNQPLPPLPGAEVEAKAIAPLLNTQPILGAQGTKAAIMQKMPQASMIHLATHGLLDDVRGLGSAIALAPSGNDDGWLTADEILDMKLQADLVVLSACNTAGGRITGDGVIGLSRALISAGVPSVIVSLWSVPDAPTAELMQAFYQHLQKNPDKAQALRQAMLTTMKTHPEPRAWAAFTLIGEAN